MGPERPITGPVSSREGANLNWTKIGRGMSASTVTDTSRVMPSHTSWLRWSIRVTGVWSAACLARYDVTALIAEGGTALSPVPLASRASAVFEEAA